MTTFPLLPYFVNIAARRRAAEEDARSAREAAARQNAAHAELGRGQAIIAAQIANREELLRLQTSLNDLGETTRLYDDPDSVLRATVIEARRVRTQQIWQWIMVGLLLPLEICFVTPHLVDIFLGKTVTLFGIAGSPTWLRLSLCLFVSGVILALTLRAKAFASVSAKVGYLALLSLTFAGAYFTDVRFEAANLAPSDKEHSISIDDTKPDPGSPGAIADSLSSAALAALPNAIFYLFGIAIHGALVFGAARPLSPEEKVLLAFDRQVLGEQLRDSHFRRDELGRQMRSEIHNAPVELRDRMLLESMRVASIINEACGEEAIQIPEQTRASELASETNSVQSDWVKSPVANRSDDTPGHYDRVLNIEDLIFG